MDKIDYVMKLALHILELAYSAHEEAERHGIQGGGTIELHASAPELVAQAADYFPPNDIVAATVMADNSTTEIDESDIKTARLRIAPVERQKIVHAAIHLLVDVGLIAHSEHDFHPEAVTDYLLTPEGWAVKKGRGSNGSSSAPMSPEEFFKRYGAPLSKKKSAKPKKK